MSIAVAAEPRLLRTVPGRARVHLPGLSELDAPVVEAQIRCAPGVRVVEASPLTRNVLVLYDRRATSEEAVLSRRARL